MNDIDHQRAQRLMLEAQVDPAAVSPTDRHWLQAHLEGCEPCAALARSSTSALEQLRAVSVAVDPELVARTRLLVKFRTRELERRRSWLLPVWILCGMSWVIGVLTALRTTALGNELRLVVGVSSRRRAHPPGRGPTPGG